MSKSAPTPLTLPAISKKGEAAPALTSFEQLPTTEAAAKIELPTPRLLSRVQATIAVTVRLDEVRYERMKTWGAGSRRVTNQEIIVAALDRFFSLSDEEREWGIASLRK